MNNVAEEKKIKQTNTGPQKCNRDCDAVMANSRGYISSVFASTNEFVTDVKRKVFFLGLVNFWIEVLNE